MTILLQVECRLGDIARLTARQRADMGTALRSVLRRGSHDGKNYPLSQDDIENGLGEITNLLSQMLKGPKKDRAYASRIRAALIAVGIPIADAYGRSPLSPAWVSELAPHDAAPCEVHTFAAMMTALSIDPIEVTNETLIQHVACLKKKRPLPSVLTSVRRLVAWLKLNGLAGKSGAHFRVPGARLKQRMRPDLPEHIIDGADAWSIYRRFPPTLDLKISAAGGNRAIKEAYLLRLTASWYLNLHGTPSTCPLLHELLTEPMLRPTIEAMAAASREMDADDMPIPIVPAQSHGM